MRSRGRILSSLLVVAAAARTGAAGIEVAIFSGPALPTYKQTFTYAGGGPQLQLARLRVTTPPSLEAEGSLGYGAAATLFFSDSFGLELRLDSVDVDLQSFGGNYALELGPPGSPVATLPVTLGEGRTDLRRVRPVSFNLRLQSQGRVGVGISGGVSYMPSVALDALPTVSVANLNASFPISLSAAPMNPDETRHLGLNGGLTLQVKVARGVSVLGEARGFAFRRSEFTWQSKQTGALSALEQALLSSIATQLDIPRFTPGFWTARVGVAFRF